MTSDFGLNQFEQASEVFPSFLRPTGPVAVDEMADQSFDEDHETVLESSCDSRQQDRIPRAPAGGIAGGRDEEAHAGNSDKQQMQEQEEVYAILQRYMST